VAAASLLPAVAAALYVAGQLQLGVAAPWRILLLIVDGQIPFGIVIPICVLIGALVASIAAARAAPRETRPAEITVRGPIGYAGPGSLGGTESALPKR